MSTEADTAIEGESLSEGADAVEMVRNPGGRPTLYNPAFLQDVANWCIAGATDFEVAENLGVSTTTLYKWKAKYPEFAQALKIGKELADDRVEAALYHRALGYSHRAVKIMQNNGVPVLVPYIEHVPPSEGAMTLWLTNRRGDKWRSKQAIEGVPGGVPLTVEIKRFSGEADGEA